MSILFLPFAIFISFICMSVLLWIYDAKGLFTCLLSSILIGGPIWGLLIGIAAYFNGDLQMDGPLIIPFFLGVPSGIILAITKYILDRSKDRDT